MSSTRDLTPNHALSRRHLLGLAAIGGATLPLLGACSGDGGNSAFKQVDAKVPDKYSNRQTIVLWTSWTKTNGDTLNALLKKFNDSQTDIYAQAQYQGSYFDAASKVTSALRAKSVPDIVGFADIVWQPFLENGYLEEFGAYADTAFQNTLVKSLASTGYVGDKLYWVPFARSTPIFYYNKNIFHQAGLPDRAPETWDELRNWGSEILKVKVNGKPAKVTALQGHDSWEVQASVWEWGGALSNGMDITIDTGGAVDAIEWHRKLVFEDKMAYLSSQYGADFKSGLVATVVNSTGSLKGTYEAAKASGFKFGTGPLPKQVSTGVPTGGAGLTILKPIPKKRKDAAWEVIKFLSTPENSAFWSLKTGYLPVIKGADKQGAYAAALKSDPNLSVAIKQMSIARARDAVSGWVPNSDATIYTGLQKIYGDNQPTQEVLTEVAKKLREGAEKVKPKYQKYFPQG